MEVCDTIYQVLGRQHLTMPNTVENWRKIATSFYTKCDIPNNIGAIDFDPEALKCWFPFPQLQREQKCYCVNHVGTELQVPLRRCRHQRAELRSGTMKALESPDNLLNISPSYPLPGSSKAVPFVIRVDEVFSLESYMLKPYPQKSLTVEERIANYWISQGQWICKNILGILSNRGRCFQAPFFLSPVKVPWPH